MIVKKMQPIGNFEEYSVDGVTLHLGDRVMDIDALQKDDQVIIDIMEDGRFVANVIIPPAMYEASDAQTADGDPLPPQSSSRWIWTRSNLSYGINQS